MKKIFIIVLAIFLLVVGGITLYFSTIDWNEHKHDIAQKFYKLTGKEVVLNGRIKFKILPTPYLNAKDVKIFNSKNEGTPFIEIKDVNAELALGPFLKGEFDVKKMILEGAVFNLDWDNGNFNWQSDLSPDQRQEMEDTKMVLNSVFLRNAIVNITIPSQNIDTKLTNLNGEVSAQSMFGPFRIEGNCMKDDTAQGFAISVGKMSESYATSLNAVFSHPNSESYIRYDGTFHILNKVMNGNVLLESKRIADFVNANNKDIKIADKYNGNLALGFDVNINEQNINLSNMVVKYGETQGSGTLDVATNGNENKAKLEFNFAELDLEPFVDFIKEKIKAHNKGENVWQNDFAIDAEIQAMKAIYKGQGIKNIIAEFNYDDAKLNVSDFEVVVPGETQVKLNGSIYSGEDNVYYKSDVEVASNNFIETLRWLNLDPKNSMEAVYKKLVGNASVAGNLDKMQISPYKITMDKSTFDGELGIIFGKRKDILLNVNADTINFDNYISQLPQEEKKKSWAQRMVYRFSKLGFLNDFDIVLNAKTDLAIYESMPFERIEFKGSLLNGKTDIDKLTIDKVANTNINMNGRIGGFGVSPILENLNYKLENNDLASFISKMELKVPDLDYKKMDKLKAEGTVNGNVDAFGINTNVKVGNTAVGYKGKVFRQGGERSFDGSLSIKNPETLSLLKGLNTKYQPKAPSLGPLEVKAKINGAKSHLELNEINAHIGYSEISGGLVYEILDEHPNIITDLKINKFEIDKFLQKEKNVILSKDEGDNSNVEFLPKPMWSKEKIDYSPYIYANLKGNFEIEEMSYKNYLFKKAVFSTEMVSGNLVINNFKANYNETPVKANAMLYMGENPKLSVNGNIEKAVTNNFKLGGKIYNIKQGTFSTRFDFSGSAGSEIEFAESLKGKAELNANIGELGGINLKNIKEDLMKRETSTGLMENLKKNIGNSSSYLDELKSRIIFDEGKFTLADSVIKSKDADIKVYGEGNVKDWNMDVVFNIKYKDDKYLPEFSVALKNSMENPSIDINAGLLFKLYESKEKQEQAKKDAEDLAEKKYWADKANGHKSNADKLLKVTRVKLEKELDEKIQTAFAQENVGKYNIIKQKISKTLANLAEKLNKIDFEKSTREDAEELKKANNFAMAELEKYGENIKAVYLDDLKKISESEYNKISGINELFKQEVFNYNENISKYEKKLEPIESSYKLDEDESFLKYKREIEANIKYQEENYLAAEEIKNTETDKFIAANFEEQNRKLTDILNQVTEGNKTIKHQIAELDDYEVQKIREAEAEFYEKVIREEDNRLIKENTGSIRIKKTGKTVKVVRNLRDIKNANKEISNDKVKVLDFSKKKPAKSEENKEKTKENEIKKPGVIRAF